MDITKNSFHRLLSYLFIDRLEGYHLFYPLKANKILGVVISITPRFPFSISCQFCSCGIFPTPTLSDHSVETNKAVNRSPRSPNRDSCTFSNNVETPRNLFVLLRITISFAYLFSFFFRYCGRFFNSVHFSLIRRVARYVSHSDTRSCLNSANSGLRRVTFPAKFRESAFLRMKFPHKAVRRRSTRRLTRRATTARRLIFFTALLCSRVRQKWKWFSISAGWKWKIRGRRIAMHRDGRASSIYNADIPR